MHSLALVLIVTSFAWLSACSSGSNLANKELVDNSLQEIDEGSDVSRNPNETLSKLDLHASPDSTPNTNSIANSRRQSQSKSGGAPALPPPATLKPGTRLTKGVTIKVGPGRAYRTPSEAAAVAKDGDTIEIDAGLYARDIAVWRQNNLTIRGVGGMAHLEANGQSAQGKAIWVIQGDNTTLDHIEFSGAKVADRNGAGIRLEGRNLTLRHSSFHDNEMGLLTGNDAESTINIEFCEFYDNTVNYQKYGRLGHNIYVGAVKSFRLAGSYIHGAEIGHNVKSRARLNIIKYNLIIDGNKGGSSYLIDLPNGGKSIIVGNLFHQSQRNDNNSMVSYGSEGHKYGNKTLYLVHNTFVNDDTSGAFIQSLGASRIRALNNFLVGPGVTVFDKDNQLQENISQGNVRTHEPHFLDRSGFDYRLRAGSPAIGKGVDLGGYDESDLTPRYVYVHALKVEPRPVGNVPDAGAYQFAPGRPSATIGTQAENSVAWN